jgi:hypothetical protein
MNLSVRLTRLANHNKLIPNLATLGSYDLLSQGVTVSCVTADQLGAFATSAHPISAAKDYWSTATHELAHWLDHTSSLWGQSSVIQVYNALDAFVQQRESGFWKVIELENARRRGRTATFYSTIDQPDAPIGAASSWRQDVSCGLAYGADGRPNSSEPIVFISFLDVSRKRIARVPLTPMALLEASATWSEYFTKMQIVRTLPKQYQAVEFTDLNKELMTALYSPRLGLYSAAAHLLARQLGITRADVAYECAAALSLLALNLPVDILGLLMIPEEIRGTWSGRWEVMLANGDRGFVFLLLCRAASPITPGMDVQLWLNNTVLAAGLPDLHEVERRVEMQLNDLPRTLQVNDSRLRDQAESVLKTGRSNATIRSIRLASPLSLDLQRGNPPLQLPPVVLGDGTLQVIAPNTITPVMSIEEMADLAWKYDGWATEFADACAE